MLICFFNDFNHPRPWVNNKNPTYRNILQCVLTLPQHIKGQHILQSDHCINKQTTRPTVVDLEDNSSKWCESENEHEHI